MKTLTASGVEDVLKNLQMPQTKPLSKPLNSTEKSQMQFHTSQIETCLTPLKYDLYFSLY